MQKFKNFAKEYSIIIVIVLLIIGFTLGNSNFLTFSNFITILRQSAILGVCGIGVMFCMIAGGINLAVGAFLSIVTVFVAIWSVNWGLDWRLGMVVSIILSTIIGYLQGIVIVKGNINPMIGSLAMKTILAGAAYLMCGGLPIYGIPQNSKMLGQGFIFKVIPIPVIVLLIVAIAVSFVFNRTYVGRKFFASGSNDEAARLSGINTQNVRIVAYTICALLAGVAGVIQYGRIGSGQPAAGLDVEMNVLTAVIIGGVSVGGGEGKVFKALCGVFLINMLINGMTLLNIGEYVQQVTRGLIFLGAVLLDSFQHRVVTPKKKESSAKQAVA